MAFHTRSIGGKMKYTWYTLNPDKAEYNAVAGCWAHHTACLELANGSIVVVGQMTCQSRECAEHELDSIADGISRGLGTEGDRHIRKAVFQSWIALHTKNERFASKMPFDSEPVTFPLEVL